MPNTITVPSATTRQQVTHDPTRVLSGDPRNIMGPNPFATMTEEIIFGGANSLLQIIDDVTGLDLLPAAQLLEGALGSAFGGAGFPNFVSFLDGLPSIDPITNLPTPNLNPTGLLSGLISWVTSGFGLLNPAESMIKQLLSGAGSLGSDITDWATHFNPADIFTAAGIFGPLMNAGKILGGLIPALDASIIQSGHFAMSLITGLEDALAGAGTGFANIVKALVPGSAGLIDDLGVWEQNLMSGDWMRQFGSALTGLHAPTIKDIENWANGLRTQAQKFSVADIFDLPDLNIFNVGQVAKPTTTPNLLPNSNFALPVLGTSPWKWEGPQLFCFTVGGTGEPVGTGHASQVGSVLNATEFNWVPVSYSAALYPMADSIADGIEKLVAAIQSVPAGSKITGVAVSQGAVVWSKVWEGEFVATGGRLHSRMSDVVGVVTFGNPRRKAGSHAPGTPDPGGHGIAATDLQANRPTWWYDYANPDDIVPTVATGTGGDFASLLYDFLVNDWDGAPETLIADVISTLGNPLGTLSSLYRMVAMVAGDAWKSLTGNNPHTTYNTVKIDGTHTSTELAVTYLNSVGAANVGTLGTTFQSNGTGSGSISVAANGTWQEWDHPEPIAVTAGQTLTLACDLMGTSISSAGGNNFRIVVERRLNDAHVDYVYPVSSTATGTFGWTTITGTYDVPSGVDTVVVGVAATNAATFGTYHVDNLTLTKTGLLPRSHVNGLQTLVSNLFGGFDTIGSLLQVPAIPSLDASKIVTGLFDALRIPTLDASKIASGLFDALRIPGLDVSKIVSGIFGAGFIPSLDASKIATGILGALRIPDITKAMSADLQSTISNLFGTTSIGTLLQVPAIPALDASKITTGLFNALRIPNLPASIINTGTFLSSLIPNLNASIINAGTFLTGLIPSLDATKITTGTFGTSLIPDITAAMSSGVTSLMSNLGAGTATLTAITTRLAKIASTGLLDAVTGLTGLLPLGNIPTLDAPRIPSLDASKIITGIFGTGQIPGLDVSKITSGIFGTGFIPGLDVSKIVSGIFGAGFIPSLDASKITSGQFAQSFITNLTNDLGLKLPTSLWQLGRLGGTNLVIDPSLSDSTVSRPTYFSTGASLAYSTAHAHSGTQCLKLTTSTMTSGQNDGLFLLPVSTSTAPDSTAIRVKSLDRYYMELFIEQDAANTATSGNAYLYVLFRDSTGVNPDSYPGFQSLAVSGISKTSFTKMSGYLQVPAGYDLMFPTLAMQNQNVGSQIYYLDDPVVREVTEPQNIISQLFGGTSVLANILAAVVPSLDATKITTGQFVSSLIPNLNASIINAGTFLSSLIPNLNASIINAGTFLSSLIPSLDATKITTGILGTGQIPGLDVSKIVTGVFGSGFIPALDAAKIATGQFVSSLIPNLNASIINAGTFLSGLIPSLDATKITTGLFGTARIPNLNASIINAGTFLTSVIPDITKAMSADLQSTISNLFGTTSIGTLVQAPAIPLLSPTKIDPLGGKLDQANIPDVIRSMSSDTQAIIDGVHQVANGGGSTGNPADSIITNLQKLFQPPPNPSTATSVTLNSVGAGNQSNNTNSFVTAQTDWAHTLVAGANMLVAQVVWESGPLNNIGGTSAFNRTVLCGASVGVGVPMTSILVEKGTSSFVETFILWNPPTGAQHITATVHSTSNYLGGNFCDGVAGESVALNGVGKIGALDTESGTGTALSQTILANTNAYIVQSFVSEHPSSFSGASITSYNKTSDYYTGNFIQGIKNVGGVNLPTGAAALFGHAPGAASVNFTATETTSGDNWYSSAIAFLPSDPAPIGSVMCQTRVATTGSTLAALFNNAPATFWDTQKQCTPDISWNASTGIATINQTGTYIVTVSYAGNLGTPGTQVRFRPTLLRNGVVEADNAPADISNSSTGFAGNGFTTSVYCNAGDTLQAGYWSSIAAASCSIVGEASGSRSQFKIALGNRSLA